MESNNNGPPNVAPSNSDVLNMFIGFNLGGNAPLNTAPSNSGIRNPTVGFKSDIDDAPSAFAAVSNHPYDLASIAFLHDGTPFPPRYNPVAIPKRLPECTRCRAHGFVSGHKGNCQFAVCLCRICQRKPHWYQSTLKLLTAPSTVKEES